MKPSAFDKVVIRNVTSQATNVHLAVHPFRCFDGIRMMMHRGDYNDLFKKEELSEWKQRLADALWDEIPGLQNLFFSNGEITLQHHGVFEDAAIAAAATEIIQPALEAQALLESSELAQDTAQD